MPDYFSHFICAERVYERLDGATKSQITSYPLYLLGAQGGDVFFAYNMKLTKANLGREMHATSAEEVFSALSKGNLSYCAGFATHYALDCTLHPAVYAYEAEHSHPFAHQRFESDLGLYISRLYQVRRRILPRESVLPCTIPIYDSIKPIAPYITVTGVERCLKRHFNYTRYLFKTKRQEYKCSYDFASLASAVDDAVDLGERALKCVLSRNIDGAIFKKAFLQK